MLIGAEHYEDIVGCSTIQYEWLPTFRETEFGWVVSGQNQLELLLMVNPAASCLMIEDSLCCFWEIEEVEQPDSTTTNKCERHFRENTMRQLDGRFDVKLPF